MKRLGASIDLIDKSMEALSLFFNTILNGRNIFFSIVIYSYI
ncbi:hypothetical protein [Clostridium polynesiense]|nr:hypothetical protein [Clostridium polynesiense]